MASDMGEEERQELMGNTPNEFLASSKSAISQVGRLHT